jgi:hypothetical protein
VQHTSLPSRPSSFSRWSTSSSNSPPTRLRVADQEHRQAHPHHQGAVESYLEEKFNEDEGAKRLQRDEIVLKKFGLLDRDFELKPFLLALLKEQIEAYYDSKTKTVNLLDWVDVRRTKAGAGARTDPRAAGPAQPTSKSGTTRLPTMFHTDSAGDQDHLARDEMDTARDAVAEGQATAVMMDYILKPLGKSLVKDPEVLDGQRPDDHVGRIRR